MNLDQSQLVNQHYLSKVLFKRSCESESSLQRENKDTVMTEQDADQEAEIGIAEAPLEEQIPNVHLVYEGICFIAEIFQGVSAKYSQLYFSQFSFHVGFKGQFQELFTACVRAGPISDRKITAYTSPELIKFGLT